MARRGLVVDEVHQVRWAAPSALNQQILVLLEAQPAYRTSSASLDRMSFARTYRPTWAIVAAILLAVTGIGLLLLLVRSTEGFTCAIDDDHAGVRLRLHGRVERLLLAALRELPDARLAPVPAGLPTNVPVATGEPPTGTSSPWLLGSARVACETPGSVAPSPVVETGSEREVPPTGVLHAVLDASVKPASTPLHLDESTRMVERGPRPSNHGAATSGRWVIRLDGVELIEVGAGLLLGRNPAAGEGEGSARLVPVADQSVSKTHAEIGVDGSGAWVVDHHSTNGTRVIDLTGERVAVPGEREPLTNGAVLRLGEVLVRIEER